MPLNFFWTGGEATIPNDAMILDEASGDAVTVQRDGDEDDGEQLAATVAESTGKPVVKPKEDVSIEAQERRAKRPRLSVDTSVIAQSVQRPTDEGVTMKIVKLGFA